MMRSHSTLGKDTADIKAKRGAVVSNRCAVWLVRGKVNSLAFGLRGVWVVVAKAATSGDEREQRDCE